jgi:FMN phosphatase YigB (HAD superfamily)
MPGTIGVAYEELLLKFHDDDVDDDNVFSAESLVLYLGKPFPSVYEIALSSISSDGDGSSDDIDKSRVVMVGDALETDVTGATVAGIDSIWVINNGIHNQDVVTAATSSINTTSASSLSSLENGCEMVLEDFNQKSESSYAKGRQVSPTFVIPHFRW